MPRLGSVDAIECDASLSSCGQPDEDAGRDGGDGCKQPPTDAAVHASPPYVDVPGSIPIANQMGRLPDF
jgi:hypothetical protein